MDAALIILYNDKKEILLQHRGDDWENVPSKWGAFGGAVDEGETPIEAVKRECMEELDYELKDPQKIFEINDDGIKYIFLEKYDPSRELVQKEGNGMAWYAIEDLDDVDLVPNSLEYWKKIPFP